MRFQSFFQSNLQASAASASMSAATADLTVCTVLEYLDKKFYTRAVIRLASMTFCEQTAILTRVLEFAKPIGGCVDITGIGLGLAEELSARFPGVLTAIHFSQNTPWTHDVEVRITDAMSVNLLGLFEAERIKIPPKINSAPACHSPNAAAKPAEFSTPHDPPPATPTTSGPSPSPPGPPEHTRSPSNGTPSHPKPACERLRSNRC
jgi:hypothetical protein